MENLFGFEENINNNNENNKLPIRELDGSTDNRLIAVSSKDNMYIGTITQQTLSKQAIIGDSEQYVKLYRTDKYNIGVYDEIKKIIGEKVITSVDLYGSMYNIREAIKILERYNELLGNNQINLDNSYVYTENTVRMKCDLSVLETDLNTITDNTNDYMLNSDIFIENKPGEAGFAKVIIKEREQAIIWNDLDIVGADYIKMIEMRENVLGRLTALALRSLNKAEDKLYLDVESEFILSDFSRKVKINFKAPNGEDYTYKAETMRPGYYNIDIDNADINLYNVKQHKRAKVSIEELFNEFALTVLNKETVDNRFNNVKYISYETNGVLNVDSGVIQCFAFKAITKILKDLYDKEIYISVDIRELRNLICLAETVKDDVRYHKKAGLLSSYIEVDSFITPNLTVDIDKELKEALKKLRDKAEEQYDEITDKIKEQCDDITDYSIF